MRVDQYVSDEHLCWYLSRPSDELTDAVKSAWLGGVGTVLDLGCGLGSELSYLAGLGWTGLGVDLSEAALRRARVAVPVCQFACADVRRLPVHDGWASALLDRGCFHYLQPADRPRYVSEARRALRPGGRFLLRACLPHRLSADSMSEAHLRDLFHDWRIHSITERGIPVDRGQLRAIEARLER